jgi:hypothetical protein
MRIASANDLASTSALFAEVRSRLSERGYKVEMTDHPTAGASLRHYLILTECPEVATGLGLSEAQRFWSRYYWLARFAREWQAVAGPDGGAAGVPGPAVSGPSRHVLRPVSRD